jgi:5-methyltetrahydrofolate--homocysteine methyltransferase
MGAERPAQMIIIGEKINGALPKTGEAIKNRCSSYIEDLARKQEACGADYLDICSGASPEEEYDTLCWLLDVVQAASGLPICLDSPNPAMFEKLIGKVAKPGIINSISGEGNKCEVALPLLKDNPEWQVIALCCDNSGGIAGSAADKMRVALDLIDKAGAFGINPERIHIDPLVLALSAANDSALNFCEAMRNIKKECPTVNIAAALSNVSFGMPLRKLVNRNFLTMAMVSGLDSVILDPTSRDIMETIYATQALLGSDRRCQKFNNAYRTGKIGSVKV